MENNKQPDTYFSENWIILATEARNAEAPNHVCIALPSHSKTPKPLKTHCIVDITTETEAQGFVGFERQRVAGTAKAQRL